MRHKSISVSKISIHPITDFLWLIIDKRVFIMAKKIAVCLAGCGVKDGSEIHEAVTLLLALDKLGAEIYCFAPEDNQHYVINHCNGSQLQETRNILIESARIARGKIQRIEEADVNQLDGLIFPGGLGAALNLCNFGLQGSKCTAREDVKKLIEDMFNAHKPIGAICIAPTLIARVLGKEHHIKVTIGTDQGTAKQIEEMGAVHVNCAVDDIVVDEENKIVTTPAYMLATRISEVATGVEKLAKKVLELA